MVLLSEATTGATDLAAAIASRKEQLNAVILAHYYQEGRHPRLCRFHRRLPATGACRC